MQSAARLTEGEFTFRDLNKNGKLGGYGGLLWRKQALLDLERSGQLSLP